MSVFHNPMLLSPSGASSFDTELIGNSVHINGTDEFLGKTFSSGSAQTKVIISTWVQKTRDSSGGSEDILCAHGGTGGASRQNRIHFTTANLITIQIETTAAATIIYDTAKTFEDIGWYHILVTVDQSKAADVQTLLFVNGIAVALTVSSGAGTFANALSSWGNASFHTFGANNGATGGLFFGGYYAQTAMIVGKSIQNEDLAVADFLDTFEYGENGSQFVPKANADIAALATTAGGNSFCLDFANSSALGNDISDEENDFAATNMAAANQSTNTPSNVFCIFNRLESTNSTVTLSEGNTRAVGAGGSDGGAIGTISMSTSGTSEFQIKANDGDGRVGIIALDGARAADQPSDNCAGGSGVNFNASYQYSENGNIRQILSSGNSDVQSGIGTWSTNDIITVRYNADDNELNFLLNNSAVGSTVSTVAGLTYTPCVSRFSDYDITAFFNSADFTHTIGSGNLEVSSANQTAPDHQGIDYFNQLNYTGNGEDIADDGLAVTGVGFKPDWAWIKNEDTSDSWGMYDVVRGVTKQLESDTSTGETDEAEGITTFGTDGFTTGSLDQVNTNTESYIVWNWLASNSTSTTSPAGSIASTSSVADTGHFSIVSYTGTGSNATIGHGLGGVPEMIWVKNRSAGDAWKIYHVGVASDAETDFVTFSTAAAVDDATNWNDTAPTSSVFSIGTNVAVNTSSENYIAYCFRSIPGVCKVATYTGDASATFFGPYVNFGFKPSFFLFYGANLADFSWNLFDTVRDPININGSSTEFLNPNGTSAVSRSSGSLSGINFLADGIKTLSSHGSANQDTQKYIYMAMADIGGGGTLPPIYGQ